MLAKKPTILHISCHGAYDIEKKEFFRAVRSLGFEVSQREADAVFDSLDADKSGKLEYKELNEVLRKGVGAEATKANLKRAPNQSQSPRRERLPLSVTSGFEGLRYTRYAGAQTNRNLGPINELFKESSLMI